jgi:microcystin degradation protein MlrC
MRRLAVARLHFCSNSFNRERTRIADFEAHEWRSGEDALALAPAGSELDGLRSFLATRPDWDATVLRSASAPPGGPLAADAFGAWLTDVETGLRTCKYDAVYLSLHGACQAEGDPTADLTILRRLRPILGRTPIVASFDVSANLSDEVPLLLDACSGNRGWPSGGGDAAAIRALEMLELILAGEQRPVGTIVRLPSLLSSLAAPHILADLWYDALPELPETVLDASLFSGFPWADSRLAGASCLVWTDRDSGLARQTAADLAERLGEAGRCPALWRPEAAIAAGLASGARFALLDPADDPMAGSAADTPGLLRALVAEPLPHRAAFGVLHDPAAVAAPLAAGIGGTLDRSFGGRASGEFGAGVPLSVTVERLAEDCPDAEDAAGMLAVFRYGPLSIVVSERRPLRIDLSLFRRAGVPVESLGMLAMKGGMEMDLELAETFPEVLACGCPGPASADLSRLPFQYVPAERRRVAVLDKLGAN